MKLQSLESCTGMMSTTMSNNGKKYRRSDMLLAIRFGGLLSQFAHSLQAGTRLVRTGNIVDFLVDLNELGRRASNNGLHTNKNAFSVEAMLCSKLTRHAVEHLTFEFENMVFGDGDEVSDKDSFAKNVRLRAAEYWEAFDVSGPGCAISDLPYFFIEELTKLIVFELKTMAQPDHPAASSLA